MEISFLTITSTPFNNTMFPMTQEEENESKSYPELDESALLVAQVKLPRVFEI